MRFSTNTSFTDRESKSRYVWDKYKEILTGKVLDVGADQMYLRQHLDESTEYVGVGLGSGPTIDLNLETEKLPFDDNHFDTVLCWTSWSMLRTRTLYLMSSAAFPLDM